MEDINAIMQAVSTVGFPIAVCCYLLLSNDKLRNVIEKNTIAITELKMMLSHYLDKEV